MTKKWLCVDWNDTKFYSFNIKEENNQLFALPISLIPQITSNGIVSYGAIQEGTWVPVKECVEIC